MNHASMLSFVDDNWKLPALNQYVADSGLPLDMFDFSRARQPVLLSDGSKFPTTMQIPVGELTYAREGSFPETLSSNNSSIFTGSNGTESPFFQSLPFIATLAAVLIIASVLTARYAGARTKPMSKAQGE